ncbi:hypothetical protein P692DRAFT_20822065 [Suillus brevipes Sb2]|nr:hypothetical protein P692DRAFT_20822065 [Suillus brevipes Sb2]
MSQSAASEGKGRKSKKARSGVLSQVNLINDEISSLQSDRSDKVSRAELKNDRYMAKLNLARQKNEHRFLTAERMQERIDAAAVHQRLQEEKDAEIRLCEAQSKKLELAMKAHAEEAALLRVKMEYHQMMNGS